MPQQREKWSEHQLEQVLGHLLRSGVVLAAIIVLAGGALYLVRHGAEPAVHDVFRGEPSDLCHVNGIVKEALLLKGRGIIQLGILVLIATPVFRVLLSAFAFWMQRDWVYVAITLIVLTVLVFSFLSGHAG